VDRADERPRHLGQDAAGDAVDHELGLVGLEQVGQLPVVLRLQVGDRLVDRGIGLSRLIPLPFPSR
jgi:hypothetical protein